MTREREYRHVTESDCKQITSDLEHSKLSAYAYARESEWSVDTIRRHVRSECQHGTRPLRSCVNQGWVLRPSVENPRESSIVCESCGGELNDRGVCGFCERLNEVLGVV